MYLEQLQFNINVASSTYARYYFDLRSLAEDNGLSFPNEYEALTKERAKQLEVSEPLRGLFLGPYSESTVPLVLS